MMRLILGYFTLVLRSNCASGSSLRVAVKIGYRKIFGQVQSLKIGYTVRSMTWHLRRLLNIRTLCSMPDVVFVLRRVIEILNLIARLLRTDKLWVIVQLAVHSLVRCQYMVDSCTHLLRGQVIASYCVSHSFVWGVSFFTIFFGVSMSGFVNFVCWLYIEFRSWRMMKS